MVLLTKMDLTELGIGLGGLAAWDGGGLGECVKWPSTVRPKQHVAWHDELEATLWHEYLCFNATLHHVKP